MASQKLQKLLKEMSLNAILTMFNGGEGDEGEELDPPDTKGYLEFLAGIRYVGDEVQFEGFDIIARDAAVVVAGDIQSDEVIEIKFKLAPGVLIDAYENGLFFADLEWVLKFPELSDECRELALSWLEQAEIIVMTAGDEDGYYDGLLEVVAASSE